MSDLVERLHRQQIRELRQTLREKEEALEASLQKVEILKEEIRTKQAVMDQKIKEAKEQLATVAKKDATIEMLKKRVENVSNEYNQGCSSGQQKPSARGFTTMKDIHKLTGEDVSYDNRG